MGRTRIELLTSGDIDMFDDVSIPLTFAVADVRQPDKRNSHFSKTIKIPGTKGNNKRFGHIFNINAVGGFNPNLKAGCTLYIDDVPQLYGYLQLLSINIDDKGDIIYSCCIIGNVSNIFQDLGDAELSDLDYSAYDHILNRTNQKATWTNTYADAYCYPFIDYGFDNNINQYKDTHFLPAIFLRNYIDKIFSSVGYTYSSTFFDSVHFKKLIIPNTGDNFKYTNEQIAAVSFEASMSSPQTITFGAGTNSQILNFDTDVSDPANAFDTTTHKWTVPFTAHYNIFVEYSQTSSSSSVYPSIDILKNPGSATPPWGGQILIGQQNFYDPSGSAVLFGFSSNNVYLTAGDVIEVRLSVFGGNAGSWTINTSGTKFSATISDNNLQHGDMIIMNNVLPRKIKQKDFLLDIIKMFNLFIEVDKNDSKKLNIETRDDFYSSGTIVDWTYKLDNSKPFEVTPMGDLNFKTLKYSYKEDSDFYNKKYISNYLSGYGNRSIEISNDFLTNTNELKLMFSATPLAAPSGDDRVIPKIWDVDLTTSQTKQKAFNIRILYNGGIKSTRNWWGYYDGTQLHLENTYLYAGHLDSVSAPTFDLNFAVPKELYYNATTYTNANLFNLYHKKYIDEITDPDSKIVTAYFHLKPSDIYNLDFRNSFYFEGQYFRLNKIYDYNPIDDSVTKCEFIKIKDGVGFSSTALTLYGGVSVPYVAGGNDDTPVVGTIGTLRSVTVFGSGNVLGNSLRNSYINGDNNYIHGGNNINLLGSSGNIIYDGLENVTLINTSGTTVTNSNTLFVNGYEITSGTIASLNDEWIEGSSSSSLFKWDSVNSFSSITITTNRYSIVGKTMTWAFYGLFTTSPAATTLHFTLPGGNIIKRDVYDRNVRISTSSEEHGFVAILNGLSYISIGNISATPLGSTTVTISFTISFEIE